MKKAQTPVECTGMIIMSERIDRVKNFTRYFEGSGENGRDRDGKKSVPGNFGFRQYELQGESFQSRCAAHST
jgi:hypothetical protein